MIRITRWRWYHFNYYYYYYYYFHYQYYYYYYYYYDYYHMYYYNNRGSSSNTNYNRILAADSTWLINVSGLCSTKYTLWRIFVHEIDRYFEIDNKRPPSLPSPSAQPGSYLFKREAKVLKTNGDGLCLGLRLLSVFIQSVPPDILFHSWPSLCEESLCYITFTPFYKFFFVVETMQKQQHYQQYC